MAGSAVGDASTNIDSQKAAALAALARGGTAGLASYQAAQQANTADRQQAIANTLASANSVGAPAGAGAELQGITNRPYDQYAATNATLQQGFAGANALRTSAADTYFREAQAAVPIVRALTEQKLATMRQQNAEKAAAKAASNRGFGGTGLSESEVKATAIGKAQQDYASAQAAQKQAQDAADAQQKKTAADELANRENISDAGRAAMHGYEVTGPMAEDQARQQALQKQLDQANTAAFLAGNHYAQVQQMPDYQRNQNAAVSLGLDPTLAAGLFLPPTPQQQVSLGTANAALGNVDATGVPRVPTAPTIRDTPDYQSGLKSAATARSQGKTYDEWASAVINANVNTMDPALLRAILADGKLILPPALSVSPTGPSTGP